MSCGKKKQGIAYPCSVGSSGFAFISASSSSTISAFRLLPLLSAWLLYFSLVPFGILNDTWSYVFDMYFVTALLCDCLYAMFSTPFLHIISPISIASNIQNAQKTPLFFYIILLAIFQKAIDI